jgi:hypothetical protein
MRLVKFPIPHSVDWNELVRFCLIYQEVTICYVTSLMSLLVTIRRGQRMKLF